MDLDCSKMSLSEAICFLVEDQFTRGQHSSTSILSFCLLSK
jgi:hypothetical protein